MNLRKAIAGTGFEVFRYREYRYFWLGAAFSNVGMWSLIFGRLWLMHDLTKSPLMVGLVTTATLGPVLLFAMWGGVIADRVNRLKLLRTTRAMFAALALLTGVLIATDVVEPWHVIAISVATGILLSFDIPSRSAMLPALVPREHLAGAIALYSIVFAGAAIIGPAILEPMVDLWGLEGVFFLVSAAYAATVGALAFMSPHGHKPESRPTTLIQGLVEGLSYVRRQQMIAGVIGLGMVVSLFGASLNTLLPELADNVITGGINTYSRLLLGAGVGGLCVIAAIAVLSARIRPARYFAIAGMGQGLGLVLLSQVTWFPGAVLVMGAIGGFHVMFATMSTTLIQTMAADEYRGRVMSLHQFTWGATALGGLMMGALGQTVSVPFALRLSGIAIAAATGAVALLSLRRLHQRTSDVATEAVTSQGPV